MKHLIVVLLMAITTIIHAKADRWEMARTNQIKQIEKRIVMLNDALTCLKSATSKESVKTCRANLKASRKQMKQEVKMRRNK